MLLKTDGRLVDIYGNEQVMFHSDGTFLKYDENGMPIYDDISDLQSDLYVIIRHRNHSAVISNTPVSFVAGKATMVDMTVTQNVMGGANSLKKIDRITVSPDTYL